MVNGHQGGAAFLSRAVFSERIGRSVVHGAAILDGAGARHDEADRIARDVSGRSCCSLLLDRKYSTRGAYEMCSPDWESILGRERTFDAAFRAYFAISDVMRRAYGDALSALGLGPDADYRFRSSLASA